jgi:hypothetical protein
VGIISFVERKGNGVMFCEEFFFNLWKMVYSLNRKNFFKQTKLIKYHLMFEKIT